jgi:DNA-directed RNA polymerase subunit F
VSNKGVDKVQPVTTPQVKALLESLGEENLDQFQRRSLDYAAKFSKVDAEAAEKLLSELEGKEGVEGEEAVQIVNCMPKSIQELRVFLAGGRRIVETAKLESILSLLDKYRKKEEG